MYKTIQTASIIGAQCLGITVEVDISGSWPGFQIIGLPDTSVQEAKERLRTAWQHAKLQFPSAARVTINLTPAHVKKHGSGFDLPMAAAMICALQNIQSDLQDTLFFGEISLNGQTRQTPGVLALALFAKEHGYKKLFIPKENIHEATLLKGLEIFPVEDISQLLRHLKGEKRIKVAQPQQHNFETTFPQDLSHIAGQEHAKRALEIAAAGGHNILFSGPPGAGKTLLARTLPSILPPLSEDQLLEVNKMYSIAGLLHKGQPIILQPPFRAPHHTASRTAIIGGGSMPKPGELSLAHHGVLFLDELPEFPRTVLEALRQPMQDRTVHISRAQASVTLPASCMVVGSLNPCPCGHHGSDNTCTCRPHLVEAYKKRISGPLLDRFDMHVTVKQVSADQLQTNTKGETSEIVRKRIITARNIQKKRFSTIICNAHMTNKYLEEVHMHQTAKQLLKHAHDSLKLSARGYHQVIKIAQTIADLAEAAQIEKEHVAQALQFRRAG